MAWGLLTSGNYTGVFLKVSSCMYCQHCGSLPGKGGKHLLVLVLVYVRCNITGMQHYFLFFFFILNSVLNCDNNKLSIRKLPFAGHQIAGVLFEVPVWQKSSQEKTTLLLNSLPPPAQWRRGMGSGGYGQFITHSLPLLPPHTLLLVQCEVPPMGDISP